MPTLRIVGSGRAGSAMALALQAQGWSLRGLLGRGDDPTQAAAGVDLCVVSTPDSVVAELAARITPCPGTVVAHLSGALGLDVLAPHERRASIHPLVALADPQRGAEALSGGAWFAVSGDPMARVVVADLSGTAIDVDEDHRAQYHAAACIASNHTVALLAQVERVAASAGVPLTAYLDLLRATIDNVAELGPSNALTGPVARGDWATVEKHVGSLDPSEVPLYLGLAQATAALAGREVPDSLRSLEVAPCS
jgi:predicted short-subunit dehydrogenase-like oxidoreductase (DUF2520 family)